MVLRFFAAMFLCFVSFTSSLNAEEKPIIGVTMSYSERENYSDRVSLTMPTIDAVTEAGGVPVLLPPIESQEDIARFFDIVDGLDRKSVV